MAGAFMLEMCCLAGLACVVCAKKTKKAKKKTEERCKVDLPRQGIDIKP